MGGEILTFFIETIDKRNQILKALLANKHYKTDDISNLTHAVNGDILVFAPNKKFSDDDISSLKNNTNLICGNLPETQINALNHKNIKYFNILNDEVFAIKNSWLTAEAVLSIILEKTPKSIFETNILILGSGRVGKATRTLFSKLGLNKFSLTSRNYNEYAENFLMCKNNFLEEEFLENLSDFDVIINTIPAITIAEKYYSRINKNCLFLEIASIETINKSLAEFEYITCPALPQKYSPSTAGQLFMEAILKVLKLPS